MACAMRSTRVSTEVKAAPLLALAGVGVEFATARGAVNAAADVNLTVDPGECLGRRG